MISEIDKTKKKKKANRIIAIGGSITYAFFVIWFLHFQSVKRDYPRMDVFDALTKALVNIFIRPYKMFPIAGGTLLMIFLLTVLAAVMIYIAITNKKLKKHDNPDTVNGDAHFMTLNEIQDYNLHYASPLGKPEINGFNNTILSEDLRLAIDGFGTGLNCNSVVFGGSGTGKSRFVASPNILQYNSNFIITDPSGELLSSYGKALEDNGYEVKVFNLTDIAHSSKYNPFHYIHTEKDVFILVNTLIKNTNGKDAKGDFWEKAENLLLTALIFYLWHTRDEKEQTMANVAQLIKSAVNPEGSEDSTKSPLDDLFEDLKRKDPDNIACSQYDLFKVSAKKTIQGILISAATRIQAFTLADIKYLTSADEFKFETFADTKQAIFAVLPTGDTTFNFIISMFYSQLFITLYTYCETTAEFGWKINAGGIDNVRVIHASNKKESKIAQKKAIKLVKEIKAGCVAKYDKEKDIYRIYTKRHRVPVGWRGTKEMTHEYMERLKKVKIEKCSRRCPIHIRFIMDEFANIGQIPDFDTKISTIRKYEISCMIIVQALSQLKKDYKDEWSTLTGNCDVFIFLGGKDPDTLKWLSDQFGEKTTTVLNTSYADKGGSSSFNKSSHGLMTVDQMAIMDKKYCIVTVRGVRPYYGKKYDVKNHPAYEYAQSRAGMFEVPYSKDAERVKVIPYRLRAMEKEASLMAAAKLAEGGNDSTVNNGVKKIYDEVSAKNKAGKKKALDSKKALDALDDNFSAESEAMIAESILSAMGIRPDSTDAEIKESAESFVKLKIASSDIVYKKTE